MLKVTVSLIVLLFGGLVLFTVLGQREPTNQTVKGEQARQTLILGYCDTFEEYAIDFYERNRSIDLERMDSTSTVLEMLMNDQIDYGVVGRRAYSHEIDEDFVEIPLEDFGYTLVANELGIIEYSDLQFHKIHTALEREIVENFFSFDTKRVIYHDNLEDALAGNITLINWEDWNDELFLLIPLENGTKVEKFRTPILYMKKDTPKLSI